MTEILDLRSNYKRIQEQNDDKVYNRFTELMEVSGAQILQVNKVIIKEFDFVNSSTTIWNIRKRVEARKKARKI